MVNPVTSKGGNLAFVDKSITALSANQAAGIDPVLPANSGRGAVMINPPGDCRATLASGAATGFPLFANVPNELAIQGAAPSGAIYVYGLAAGQYLTMWEG